MNIDSYYKVSVRTKHDVSDGDILHRPRERLPSLRHAFDPGEHRFVWNWVFTFDSQISDSREKASALAEEKLAAVNTRLALLEPGREPPKATLSMVDRRSFAS